MNINGNTANEGNESVANLNTGKNINKYDSESNTKDILNNNNFGFNYGAFFLTIFWLFAHGKSIAAILLLVANIIIGAAIPNSNGFQYLKIVLGITISIYYGIRGNRISMDYHGYDTIQETNMKEKGWNIAGIIIFIVICLLSLIIHLLK